MPTLTPRPTTTRAAHAAASRRRARKVALAVVGSLLLHGFLILLLGYVLPHWPRSHVKGKPLGALTVTILPSEPTPTPTSGATAPRPNSPEYMRTLDEQQSAEKPKDAAFISDKNTQAASEQPATGNLPMPTQEGRESTSFDFDTRNYTAGKQAADTSAEAAAAAQPTEQAQAAATPPPANPRSTPPPSVQATPPPDNAELAVAKPQPSATPEPSKPTENEAANTPPPPTQRQPANPGSTATVPNPGQIKTPGYQPQTVRTKFSGSINNRGRSAVAAIGTPLGRYYKAVQDSIGAVWYYRTKDKMDVVTTGRVKFHFYIDRSGKPTRVRVVDGATGSALASISNGAILDADIPPMPADVSELLGGEMEMDLGFEMYEPR